MALNHPGGHPERTPKTVVGGERPWDHRSIDDHAVAPPRRLRRRSQGRVVAGVAGGLADFLGLEPLAVRVAFVVLSIAGATGVVLYVLGWLLLPTEDDEEPLVRAAVRRGRADAGQVLSLAAVVVGTLLLVRQLGVWFDDRLVWPAALVVVGLGVVWHQADPDQRATWLGRKPAGGVATPEGRLGLLTLGRASGVRIAVGLALVAFGGTVFLAVNRSVAAARQGLLAGLGVTVGVLLLFGPWWWRLARAYAAERAQRIRQQERAEVAAHLHDSVLQTLALIQRQGHDPDAVVRLARRQERELRAWLYGPPEQPPEQTLGGALRQVAADVEDDHATAVEVVVVGDRPLDETLLPLVQAAREAMVNAARWSGAARVSVYAEGSGEGACVFVRDDGAGFDPASVTPDHHGIADSIMGRMERHGGGAVVRSAPGEGTEVELSIGSGPAPAPAPAPALPGEER